MGENTCDVAIVGGGLSGLSAAYRLRQRCPDLKVVVLEASPERVGGRTHSIPVKNPATGDDDVFDLGGHWVSTAQSDIMDLMGELGVGYYRQNTKGRKVFIDRRGGIRTYKSDIPSIGSWMALAEMQRMINKVEALAASVDIRDPYASPYAHDLDSMTVATLLKMSCKHEAVYDMFNAAMNSSLGCDLSQISALYFLAYANAAGGMMKLFLADEDHAQEFRVKGGTQQISIKLADKLGKETVVLGKKVTDINSESGTKSVNVVCSDGSSYKAKRVICTTPAPRTAEISFEPPLSAGRRALYGSLTMGNMVKIFAFYDEPFWIKAGYSGEVVTAGGKSPTEACERGPMCICFDATTYKDTPAVVGFIAGRNADQWFSMPAEERKKAVLHQIYISFGYVRKALSPARYIEKVWPEEGAVGGAPVLYTPPGAMHNFHWIRRPHAAGLVLFAGTETSVEWPGYLTGAVKSGYRAAAEVVADMSPEKMVREDKEMLEDLTKNSMGGRYRDIARRDWRPGMSIKGMVVHAALLGFVVYIHRYRLQFFLEDCVDAAKNFKVGNVFSFFKK